MKLKIEMAEASTIFELQFERKAMVGEPKSYHKTPKTSYLKEGFSGTVSAQIERHSRLERHVGKTQIKRQSEIKRN